MLRVNAMARAVSHTEAGRAVARAGGPASRGEPGRAAWAGRAGRGRDYRPSSEAGICWRNCAASGTAEPLVDLPSSSTANATSPR